MDDSPSPRAVYTPSGRFDTADLAVACVALTAAALALAASLAYALRSETYLAGWITIPVGGIFAAFIMWIVPASNCRNRGLACVLGFVGGLLFLTSFYHIDQSLRWGVGWEHIERVPGYVAFRMETDSWEFPAGRRPFAVVIPQPAQAGHTPWLPGPKGWNWHWGIFLLEIGTFVLLPAAVGWVQAGYPFSEQFDDWLAHESVILTPNSAKALRQALAERTLPTWVETGVEKTVETEWCKEVTVWYFPRPSSEHPGDSEVYLSIGSGRPVQLEMEEAAALVGLMPGLRALAVPAENEFEPTVQPATTLDSHNSGACIAQLFQIPGPYVGRAQDPGVILRSRLLSVVMLLLPIPFVIGFIASVNPLRKLLQAVGVPEGIVLVMIVSYVVLVGGLLLLLTRRWYPPGGNAPFLAMVLYRRNAMHLQAAQRTDALFRPETSEAIYAEIVPRRTWSDPSRGRKENETGLLILDDERGLLFEGDRNRYVIPISSMLRCEIEEVTHFGTTAGLFAVVLLVQSASGSHELPIVALDGVPGANYWEKAVALAQMISARWENQNASDTLPPSA